jgi:hypothetical protein
LPDDRLDTAGLKRRRSYRMVGHHIFRIPETSLEVANGAQLVNERLTAQPPDTMHGAAAAPVCVE